MNRDFVNHGPAMPPIKALFAAAGVPRGRGHAASDARCYIALDRAGFRVRRPIPAHYAFPVLKSHAGRACFVLDLPLWL